MSTQRVLVYVDKADQAGRAFVEANVTQVLASYSYGLLVEATEAQVATLEAQGYTVEPQPNATMINLRAVTFDTSEGAPTRSLAFATAAQPDAGTLAHWIVQFVGPILPEWREAVAAAGAAIGDFVPEFAYLVQMTPQTAAQIRQLPYVNWVGLYRPDYKLSPLLMGERAPAASSELNSRGVDPDSFKPEPGGNITIQVHDAQAVDKVAQEVERLGGVAGGRSGVTLRAALDLNQVAELAAMPEVKWIEPFRRARLTNDVAAGIMAVQPVWDQHGLDGEGEIVAVCDSGLDTGVNDATMHDDFEGRIVNIHSWPVEATFRPWMNNASWDDGAADLDSGHGTHVAGSVLGNGTRSGGAIRGMAPNARLVFQAVEQYADWKPSAGAADGYYLLGIPVDLNQLFQQAFNDGARIHTNSWSDDSHGQYTDAAQDIDEFLWNHKQSIILYSACNDGRDGNSNGVIDSDSVASQGCAKNCITVGASENNRMTGGYNPNTYGTLWPFDYPANPIRDDRVSDDPEGMVAFSGRGPADDGRIKPDIVAPGTNVLSVRASTTTDTGWGLLPAGDPNRNFYKYMGGTSMSTPLTAGAVALIRQFLRKVHLHTPSGALLKALLLHGAHPVAGQYTPSEAGTPPNNDQGWGRVDLRNATVPAYPLKLEFRDNAADAVATGEQHDYTFQVVNTTVPLRATLVWTDFPATPAAGGLVNRLRLSVIAPGGAVTQGNPANNNVQQVVINTPQVGAYTVRVTGLNVATAAKQDFALALTAGLSFVDLYIRDNLDDDGIEPSRGTLYMSPDIWVSLTNDPLAPAAAHPEYGQTNFVFVRVHNRGSAAANNAQVRLYWAKAGTNLSRPHWKTDGIKVDGVAGNLRTVNVPAHGAASPSSVVTAAFEWQPPDPSTYTVDPGHFCLFATVTHPDDPIVQEDVDAVRWEDNLAWKNVNVQDTLPNSTATLEFYVAGLASAATGSLHIDRSGLPGGEVTLHLPTRYLTSGQVVNLETVEQSPGGRSSTVRVTSAGTADIRDFDLNRNENTLVRLQATLPEDARDGEIYPVYVEQRTNGVLTGRVTLLARTVATPAYIGNRNSGELHLANCPWVRKMSPRNKAPYNDLALALQRGYNGCRFCMPQQDTG